MSETTQTFLKAFSVNFSNLNRWDPNSFHNIKWHWDQSVMIPIGSILTLRKEKIDRNKHAFSDLMPITIHFDGSIEPRKISDSTEYSMELFRAMSGDIVVSKIDLKNGAVAIIPDNWDKVVVTNHFAVYKPDLEIVNPKYFYLLIQANFFKAHLWRNKVGAEGRKEVKIKFFEELEIPVPNLLIQQKIVNYWNKAQQQLSATEQSLENLINELHTYLVKQTQAFEQVVHSKVFLANYSKTQQWDIKAGRAATFIAANPNFVRLGDFTEECIDSCKPWEEPDKKWLIYGVSNKNGVFLSSEQLGKDFNAAYKKIKKGWFFHNPTRANVGSLGIVPEVPYDAITSPEYQVWKLTGEFLSDFMALVLKTNYFLELVAFNRVGGVKQRMYYANLAEIRLPRIPEKVQQDFVDKYKVVMENIKTESLTLTQRKTEIDQMILGIRSVEEI